MPSAFLCSRQFSYFSNLENRYIFAGLYYSQILKDKEKRMEKKTLQSENRIWNTTPFDMGLCFDADNSAYELTE